MSLLTLICALVLVGCATGMPKGSQDELQVGEGSVGPIPVAVENRSQFNVAVYAMRGSIRQRIGNIAANTKATMTVPATLTDDRGGVTIQVLQIGGSQSYLSDQVVPDAGSRLVLTIQPRLTASSLSLQ